MVLTIFLRQSVFCYFFFFFVKNYVRSFIIIIIIHRRSVAHNRFIQWNDLSQCFQIRYFFVFLFFFFWAKKFDVYYYYFLFFFTCITVLRRLWARLPEIAFYLHFSTVIRANFADNETRQSTGVYSIVSLCVLDICFVFSFPRHPTKKKKTEMAIEHAYFRRIDAYFYFPYSVTRDKIIWFLDLFSTHTHYTNTLLLIYFFIPHRPPHVYMWSRMAVKEQNDITCVRTERFWKSLLKRWYLYCKINWRFLVKM